MHNECFAAIAELNPLIDNFYIYLRYLPAYYLHTTTTVLLA